MILQSLDFFTHSSRMRAMQKKNIWEVPRRFVDQRFDVVALGLLQEHYALRQFSRGEVARLITAGAITLNTKLKQARHRVRLHDTIEIIEQALLVKDRTLIDYPDFMIPVIYEDDALLVIDKPAGIQVHPAGNVVEQPTVAHFIATHYPAMRHIGGNSMRPGIVHRLDRETSGALVVAKTEEALRELKKLFKNRWIEKTYLALVYGHMPAQSDVINKPLMQRSGERKRLVVESRMAPVAAAREAITSYRVIVRYQDFDLLMVMPKTGRTHQIRAHLASLGHPIVGDKLYAFKSMRRGKQLFAERHMLHAQRLQFEWFSKKYVFEAPLPQDFQTLLHRVDETRKASYDDEALTSLLLE